MVLRAPLWCSFITLESSVRGHVHVPPSDSWYLCPSVVLLGDGLVSFLACRIPETNKYI